jgi:nucleoside-diphosphate-sugar epimerase
MKILVTGGAGYIGSVLVPRLLAEGHDVTVIDSFMYQQTPLLDCAVNPRLQIIRGDVRDERIMSGLLPKFDAILPLACLTGAPICDKDPVSAKSINHDAVRFLAEKKSTQQMLVFPSTNSGYGVGEAGIECNEDTPLRPVSLYGRLKVELEKYLLDRGDCVTCSSTISPTVRWSIASSSSSSRISSGTTCMCGTARAHSSTRWQITTR